MSPRGVTAPPAPVLPAARISSTARTVCRIDALDTSALMAILLGEPQGDACATALETDKELLISAATVAEALIVAARYGHFSEAELRAAVKATTACEIEAGSPAKSPAVEAEAEAAHSQVVEKNGSSGRTRTYNPPVNRCDKGHNSGSTQ
ncbi:MAG: PIN domain-containing protein [Terriglobales bacterium]